VRTRFRRLPGADASGPAAVARTAVHVQADEVLHGSRVGRLPLAGTRGAMEGPSGGEPRRPTVPLEQRGPGVESGYTAETADRLLRLPGARRDVQLLRDPRPAAHPVHHDLHLESAGQQVQLRLRGDRAPAGQRGAVHDPEVPRAQRVRQGHPHGGHLCQHSPVGAQSVPGPG